MPYTQAQLATQVLRDLQAIDATSPPAAEDVAVVLEISGPVFTDLINRRVVPAFTPDAIPDALFSDLVRLVVERCAPRFGRETSFDTFKAAEDRLVALTRLDRTTPTVLVQSVLEQLAIWGVAQAAIDATTVAARIPSALASLAARNVIYFADEADVSDAAFDAVTRYVAARLAPKPADGIVGEAEAELRTLARIGSGTGRRTLRIDGALLGGRGR